MSLARVGSALRAVRIRSRLRQQDVAERAGVGASTVSRIERGHAAALSLATIQAVARAIGVDVDVVARWRGGDLDRLLNRAHSALHESVARWFTTLAGWVAIPEVSFAIYGERGVIDILAWHAATRTLLVIELKTAIVDINDLLATMDRRLRLARQIARERGWDPVVVGGWIIVAEGSTNRRRIAAHANVLRTAFPHDGTFARRWMAAPSGPLRALSLWSYGHGQTGTQALTSPQRVRKSSTRGAERGTGRQVDSRATVRRPGRS